MQDKRARCAPLSVFSPVAFLRARIMSKGRGLFVVSPCGELGGEEGKNMKSARWWKELFVGKAVTGWDCKTKQEGAVRISPLATCRKM